MFRASRLTLVWPALCFPQTNTGRSRRRVSWSRIWSISWALRLKPRTETRERSESPHASSGLTHRFCVLIYGVFLFRSSSSIRVAAPVIGPIRPSPNRRRNPSSLRRTSRSSRRSISQISDVWELMCAEWLIDWLTDAELLFGYFWMCVF